MVVSVTATQYSLDDLNLPIEASWRAWNNIDDGSFSLKDIDIDRDLVIRQDIEAKGLSEDILLDRNEWRKLIYVPNLT